MEDSIRRLNNIMKDEMGDGVYPLSPVAIVQEMIDCGLKYGSEYSKEYFAQRSLKSLDDPYLWTIVSRVNEILIEKGYVLTARGTDHKGYRVHEIAYHEKKMTSWLQSGIGKIWKANVLGLKSDTSTLSDSDKARHEHVTRRAGFILGIAKKAMRQRNPFKLDDDEPKQLPQ